MLFDEAIDLLIQHLDETTLGSLVIGVENGLYQASFSTALRECEGKEKPVLTDALASLLETLDHPGAV